MSYNPVADNIHRKRNLLTSNEVQFYTENGLLGFLAAKGRGFGKLVVDFLLVDN